MNTAEVVLPNGKIVENVPIGTTKKELYRKLIDNGMAIPSDFHAPIPKLKPPRPDGSFIDPLAQGLTLGWGEEWGGLGAYIGSRAAGANHNRGAMAMDREIKGQRERLANYRDDNPLTSTGLEIGGAMVSGGPFVKYAKTIPGLLKTGAIEGAIAGAGSADKHKLTSGLLGSALGLGMAGLVPGMTALAKRGASEINGHLINPIRQWFDETPNTAAQRILKDKLGDITPDELLRRQAEMGPMATPADIGGPKASGLTQGVVMNSPNARAMAETLSETRRAGASTRLNKGIQDATGIKQRMLTIYDEIRDRQSRNAERLYRDAYAVDIVPDAELVEIMNRPGIKRSLPKALASAKNEGRELPYLEKIVMQGDDFRFTTETIPDMKALDQIKQHMDRVVSSAYRNGDEGARSLKIARNALRKKLDLLNDKYKDARSVFAGDQALQDSMLEGEKFLNQSTRKVRELTRDLTPSEKESYLSGAVEAMREKIGRARSGEIGQFKFLENDNAREKLAMILPSQSKVDDILRMLKTERTYAENEALWIKGSQTALRDAAAKDLSANALMPGSLEAVNNPLQSGANAFMAKMQKALSGHKPATYDRLGEVMLTPNNANEVIGLLNQQALAPELLGDILNRHSGVSTYLAPGAGLLGGQIINEF